MVVRHARGANDIVVGQDHFHQGLAVGAKFFGVGDNLQTFGHRGTASAFGNRASGEFHHADAAIGRGRQIGMVTEPGDVDPVLVGGFYDGHGVWNFQMLTIDPDIYSFSHFISSLFYFFVIAMNSSLKYSTAERITITGDWPRAQKLVASIVSEMVTIKSRSSMVPWPFLILVLSL